MGAKDPLLLAAERTDGGTGVGSASGGVAAALAAALPMLILSYSSCVSYAQLIVAGSPASANVVAALHLLGSGITGIVLPLTSKCPLTVSSADITVTIFYTRVVQDVVAAATASGASDHEVAATVLLALPVNTVLMSVILLVLARAKAMAAINYLHYPVVAGFLGTIGWAIFSGAFAVLAGGAVAMPSGLPQLASDKPGQLGCALALALSMVCLKSLGCPAKVLAIAPLIVAFGGFWAYVMAFGISNEDLLQEGFLFPPASVHAFWSVWTDQEPRSVVWSALLPRAGTFGGLGLVLILSLCLRVAGVESATGTVLSTDHEVMWTGIANLGVGAVGGVIGSVSPGLTTFNKTAGNTDAASGVITAVLTLLIWLSGLPIMNVLPRFLLAGILMNLGLSMLLEWLWNARDKLGPTGLGVVYVQVGCSICLGLLPSVLLGVVAACVFGTLTMMSLHVLKYHVSGNSLRSYVSRPVEELRCLAAHASEIQACNYVKRYIEGQPAVRYLVLDLRACHGTNPSGCSHIAKLDSFLHEREVTLVHAEVDPNMSERLALFGDRDRHFSTLTQALEFCENRLLEANGCVPLQRKMSSWGTMEEEKNDVERGLRWAEAAADELLPALARFLECPEAQAGHLAERGTWATLDCQQDLAEQGAVSDTLYLAVPGFSQVSVEEDVGQAGSDLVIAVEKCGAICGAEGALFGARSRSTCRVAASGSRVLQLQASAVQDLACGEPELHRRLLRLAAASMLRRGDVLAGTAKLASGGGWMGATFDADTARIASGFSIPEMRGSRLGSMLRARTPTIVAQATVWGNQHTRGRRSQ